MGNNYKITVYNQTIQKDFKLLAEAGQMKLGTSPGDDFRLRKDMFFESIEVNFICANGQWTIYTAENLYIALPDGDVRKLNSKSLKHGDVVEIHYQASGNPAFAIEFTIDFNDGRREFDRYADISGQQLISIGTGANCHVILSGQYVSNDYAELVRCGNDFSLKIVNTTFGVTVNGRSAPDGSIVKNGDFFSFADNYLYIKNNKIWCKKGGNVSFNGLAVYDTVKRGSYPRFKRNSRVRIVVNDDKIDLLDPSEAPQKPKDNLLMKLMPSIGMLIAAGVMAAVGSASMLIFSGVSVAIAIVTAVITFRRNNKDYEEKVNERITTYNNYIANKKTEIEAARTEELNTLEEIYISETEENSRIHAFSADLFDRTKEDEDFLSLRLGVGDVEAKRRIEYKHREKLQPGDELQQIPEQIEAEYRYIHGAPITLDLKAVNAVGVTGPVQYRYEIMKNMVIDITARHYYTDISLIFVAKEQNADKLSWLRFHPSVYNDILGVRNIVSNDDSKTLIFEYLYKELTARKDGKSHDTEIIVFLYDEYDLQTHPISKFVEKAAELGVTFIFFADVKGDIPLGCDYIINIADEKTGYLTDAHDRLNTKGFWYDTLSQGQAERIIELMAPVYTDEISLEGSLRKNISMFEMLNIIAVDDIDLAKRWASTNVTKSMAAPIGVTKTGLTALDLHDKAHGPHGLVAGTTGSGKSEILQTYILSMATLFHPYEVGFVIIDFKGGGMVNQFAGLPHLMGAITNIDGKEINRSLKSIKAELQKRQRLFAEAEVNHIDKYIEKFKSRQVSVPLPHLIIIVDEFAELKAEQPEFMKELISAARIGRSLGVHLILATQKPAGQVNEQIWSNSRFKLCLKVQSAQDSNEVLKSPLAAEIKEPGRAYFQVGNNEIFELLQSAYSGAPEKADDTGVREFALFEITDTAKRLPVYVQKKKKSSGNMTQLDAIVKYVSEYCDRKLIKKLPDICLPPLPEIIAFPEVTGLPCRKKSISPDTPEKQGAFVAAGKTDRLPDKPVPEHITRGMTEASGSVKEAFSIHKKDICMTTEIGIYDDPDSQYQGEYAIRLGDQNTMIIGSSQSGKTNLLQTILRCITTKYSPGEVNIYIIDFGSMILKNFEALNHVGGVVIPSEDEKLKNLLKLLHTEIETRKEKLISVGVSSFMAYKEAGFEDLPQIILIIDNLTTLKELYFKDDDELINLCREGLSAGISIVVANAHTNGIGYKYLSNFSNRIALFCNDSNEYSSLFDFCRERLDDIKGRALVEIDKTRYECQTFMAFEGEKEIERARAIRNFVEQCNAAYPDVRARLIPEIPEVLTDAYVRDNFAKYMSKKEELVIGVNYASVMPFVLNLRSLGILAVSGREHSGRNNFLHYLVNALERNNPKATEFYIADSIDRKLMDLQKAANVKCYGYMPDSAIAMINDINTELAARYEAMMAGDDSIIDNSALIVLILNGKDAAEAICGNSDALNAFKTATGKYKNFNFAVILGSFENTFIGYDAPEIIKNVKNTKHILFFDDLSNMKAIDVSITAARQFKKRVEAGDAYYIKENEITKIKTVLEKPAYGN